MIISNHSKSKLLVILVFCSVFLVNTNSARATPVVEADFVAFINENPNALILDIRWQAVYDQGHIFGAFLIDSSGSNEVKQSAVDSILISESASKSTPIALYCNCGDGLEASKLANYLESNGYINIVWLSHSFSLWQNNSYINKGSERFSLAISSDWTGCQDVEGNINNDLHGASASTVIGSFWQALLNMKVGEIKAFVVSASEHPYSTGLLAGKDLFYIVRIQQIHSPVNTTQVMAISEVDVFYSLYIDCDVIQSSIISSASDSVVSSSSSSKNTSDLSSTDNSITTTSGYSLMMVLISTISFFLVKKFRRVK